ncbi:MAG: arginine--tRNA ligase [Candidatus Magasanikbacteria bacterium]|nr:arginine--tRNA ligase [Candidatus Magasanikbacteria bacterium]
MIQYVRDHIAGLLEAIQIDEAGIILTTPPKKEMGDVAFPVFQYAKEHKLNPADAAKLLAEKFNAETEDTLVERAEAFGPYVNFFLNDQELAHIVLNLTEHNTSVVPDSKGTVMIEYACPNTHKAFHIGHLRNVILGESLVRLHEYAGYRVIRANYQGDVGMHIAKCLWGIEQLKDEYDAVLKASIQDRMKFVGKAYAHGATAFETDKKTEEEIKGYNEMIYRKDQSIKEVYETTRGWSLEYLENIYKLLDTKFDRYYFESEIFARAGDIVHEQVVKGVFVQSEGAVIFKGSEHGLHDRVFFTTAGFPTYEAKDLALAEKQFAEFHPDGIYHVIGPEQSDYLKVLFKALEYTLPESKNKEFHVPYGWVTLKGGKMSSRTGNVVPAESLISEVEDHIREHIETSEVKAKLSAEEKAGTITKVAMGAIKYAFLKTGRTNDMVFDMEESVSTSGDSGPYLLYIVARFKSIIAKSTPMSVGRELYIPEVLEPSEKGLVTKLGEFTAAVEDAVSKQDPSCIAQYQFELAQAGSRFYQECPVLGSPEPIQEFRIALISKVVHTMERGFDLLGITTVEHM